jgi:hypothetical protein
VQQLVTMIIQKYLLISYDRFDCDGIVRLDESIEASLFRDRVE